MNLLLKDDKGTKLFYNKFISHLDNKCKFPEKWKIDIDMENDDCQKINALIILSTKNTKLQWLQYRIVHRTLATKNYGRTLKLKMIVNVPFVIIIQKHLLIYFSTVHMFIECGLIYKTG